MGPSNPSGYLDLCGLCSRMLRKIVVSFNKNCRGAKREKPKVTIEFVIRARVKVTFPYLSYFSTDHGCCVPHAKWTRGSSPQSCGQLHSQHRERNLGSQSRYRKKWP